MHIYTAFNRVNIIKNQSYKHMLTIRYKVVSIFYTEQKQFSI